MSASLPLSFLQELTHILSAEQILTRPQDRARYANDLWSKGLIKSVVGSHPASIPDLVVCPKTTDEVQHIVKQCTRYRIPMTPFGAGSGVCGAAATNQGIVIDTKEMKRILSVDPHRGMIVCEPGVLGHHLEQEANRHGLTLGHFPSSLFCSTVGGWIATRSAGQCSTHYGGIDDLTLSLEFVTPLGEVRQANYHPAGNSDAQLLLGSEGILGIITKITLLLRLKDFQLLQGWSFPDVTSGTKAISLVLKAGLRPAVVRLYDPLDSLFAFSKFLFSKETSLIQDALSLVSPQNGSSFSSHSSRSLAEELARLIPTSQTVLPLWRKVLWEAFFLAPSIMAKMNQFLSQGLTFLSTPSMLILGFEGHKRKVDFDQKAASEILLKAGGKPKGERPGNHWLLHRYEVGYKLPKVFAVGAFADTLEVATTYSRLIPLYQAVRKALAPHALTLAHFSHAYEGGCSIYFTFLRPRKSSLLKESDSRKESFLHRDLTDYDQIWHIALETVIAYGGTISHHHGIGQLKQPFLEKEHGKSLLLLQALKTSMDPQNLMNPGKWVLPAPISSSISFPAPRKEQEPLFPSSSQIHFIHPQDQYCEVDATIQLHSLETELQKRGFSLGPLPAWSYARTLKEALSLPLASEACSLFGTLSERCLQLTTHHESFGRMIFPRNLSPKRASGPDLRFLVLGANGTLGTIQKATLQLTQLPKHHLTVGWLFSHPETAFQVFFKLRDFYHGLGPSEIQLLSPEWASAKPKPSGMKGSFLPGAPVSRKHHSSAAKPVILAVRLTGPHELIQKEAAFVSQLCAEVKATLLQPQSVETVLSPWLSLWKNKRISAPKHEYFLQAPSYEDLLSAWEKAPSKKRLCGIHARGVTLCSDDTWQDAPISHTDAFSKALLESLQLKLGVES